MSEDTYRFVTYFMVAPVVLLLGYPMAFILSGVFRQTGGAGIVYYLMGSLFLMMLVSIIPILRGGGGGGGEGAIRKK